MKYQPHNYQQHAFDHIIDNPACGLFMDMGLGKTVVTLTAINRMIYQECEVEKVLVVGPKRVIRSVWTNEAAKWDHLKHLKLSVVWGTPEQRIKALRTKSDVYLINRENLVWLVNLFQSKFPFKVVILDESSSFKNHKAQRFRALKLVRDYVSRMILLTGTPSPNGLIDLWAPLFLLDKGERLEKTIGGFRERYFAADKKSGYITYSYRIRKDSQQVIYNKISDICISMKKEDFLDLPPIIENEILIDLDPHAQAKYDKFEEDSIMEIVGKEITAVNAAALNTKLMQFANGAIYHEDKSWTEIHDAKLEALEEIIEEANGQNILVAYSYRHDLERIQKKFPQARTLNSPKDEEDWNAGKIPLLVIHPASAGHGLNLQKGGHIVVWFGMTWNLEHYQQLPARLDRQGQENPVIMHKIIVNKTIDVDASNSLAKKEAGQNELMKAIRARVNKYLTK